MRTRLSRSDWLSLGVLAALGVAAAFEAAVALEWIPVGEVPDEGARYEAFFLAFGWFAMLAVFFCSLFLAVANRRWTPGILFGAAAAGLVAAHAYTFNTYDLPTHVRYTESGTPSASWVAWIVLAGLFSSLLSLMFPRIGFVTTSAVVVMCLFTFTFTGCCN